MSDRLDRKDIRILVGAVAQFAASFESRLRQIEPALTLSQLVALERVVQQPKLRPFQLATQMKISRQLAWQTCKRLEGLGLLRMSDMSAGKRGVEVEATDAGIAHLRQVSGLHAAIAEALQARGDRLDMGMVRAGLQRLTAAASRLGGAEEGGAESGEGGGRRRGRLRQAAAAEAPQAEAPQEEAPEAVPTPPEEPAAGKVG